MLVYKFAHVLVDTLLLGIKALLVEGLTVGASECARKLSDRDIKVNPAQEGILQIEQG